jgi:hypothetical protein
LRFPESKAQVVSGGSLPAAWFSLKAEFSVISIFADLCAFAAENLRLIFF